MNASNYNIDVLSKKYMLSYSLDFVHMLKNWEKSALVETLI